MFYRQLQLVDFCRHLDLAVVDVLVIVGDIVANIVDRHAVAAVFLCNQIYDVGIEDFGDLLKARQVQPRFAAFYFCVAVGR